MKRHIALLILATLTFAAASPVRASSYPLKVCIVTNDEIGDAPVSVDYNGRHITLCCKSCVKKFNSNPAKYLVILDKELAKRKR